MGETKQVVLLEFRDSLDDIDVDKYLKNVFRKSGQFPDCIIKRDGQLVYSIGIPADRLYDSLDKQVRKIASERGINLRYDIRIETTMDLSLDKGELDTSQVPEIKSLEFMLKKAEEEKAWAVGEIEKLQRENEEAKHIKSEALRADEYKLETENMRKANKGLSEARKQAKDEAKALQGKIESLQQDYESLLKNLEDIDQTKISEPVDVVTRKLTDSANYLISIGGVLEKIIRDENVDNLLKAGKQSFYEYVNGKANLKFDSDEQVNGVLSVKVPFEGTEYARINVDKYSKLDKALETLANMRAMPDVFGQAVDVTKLLEKEEELKAFKEEYAAKQKEHADKYQLSQNLQSIREFYDQAKSLDEYLARAKDKMTIPCLINTTPNSRKTVITLPKSEYFLKQLEPTLRDLPGGIEFSKEGCCDIVSYTCDNDVNQVQDVASLLFAKQKETEFSKLGFKLQIYTITKLD